MATIVLVDLNQYAPYATGRGVDIAIPQAQLLPVSPTGGGSFGFHPNMPEVRDLFNQGRLAVVCNNGPLVEPLTRTTYQNGTGKKPLQLFSHSDQVGLFQTAIANVVAQTGWAGRVSDLTKALNGLATFPSNVSIAGINLLLTGIDTRQLAVADSNTTLANVLQLNNGAGASTSDNNARNASFTELRTLDNTFKLVKAASALEYRYSMNCLILLPDPGAAFPKPSSSPTLQIARIIEACTDRRRHHRKASFSCPNRRLYTHSGQILGQGNYDAVSIHE